MEGKDEQEQQSHLPRSLQAALARRETRGTRRQLKSISASSVDFSSNDFLSLGTSPSFRATYLDNITRASEKCRLSGSGSRLLDGNSQYAEDLEALIADFHKAPCGLLFNSGFDANSGVFSCVPQPGDVIIHDELIHASVHDGMRLSRAGKRVPFRHNSVKEFERVLQAEIDNDPLIKAGKRSVFIAVESLYSMDGDFAPIREILDVIDTSLPHKNGYMIVDEAHSTGVFGERGAGVVQSLGVEDRVFLRLHTFGKALAGNGAIVLCSWLTRSYILNYARPLIFTSALGLPALVLIRTAYEFMVQGKTEKLQSQLQERIKFLAESLNNAIPSSYSPLLKVGHHSASPIFALQTRYPRDLAQVCQDRGLIARAIMSPTVPTGTERVRVCLHAGNTEDEIQQLVDIVEMWAKHIKQQEKPNL